MRPPIPGPTDQLGEYSINNNLKERALAQFQPNLNYEEQKKLLLVIAQNKVQSDVKRIIENKNQFY